MKKSLAKIIPHIIPELKLLFTLILPIGILLSFIFVSTEAQFIIRDIVQLFLYGLLLSIGGIYLMRITAYVILRVLTQIPYVIPDVYYDESKNKKP